MEKKLATGCVAFFSRNPGIFHLLPLYPCSLLCLYGTAKNRATLLQFDFSYSIKYDWVSLDEISPNMQLAVIAAEDQKFQTIGALILRQFKRPLNLMKNLAEPEALQRFHSKLRKTSFSGMDKVGFVKG